MHGRSRFGLKVRADQWIAQEYKALQDLYAIGSNVPRPYALADRALLMEFVGDSDGVAPQLNSVKLDDQEALLLFDQLMDSITLWLAHNWIHADLSPFNVLYMNRRLNSNQWASILSASSDLDHC